MRTRYDWIANWKLMLTEIGWKWKLVVISSGILLGALGTRMRTGFVVMNAGENRVSHSVLC
jgi:hypothetical protein